MAQRRRKRARSSWIVTVAVLAATAALLALVVRYWPEKGGAGEEITAEERQRLEAILTQEAERQEEGRGR